MQKTIRALHDDEEGISAIQVVMILAIAAAILGLVKVSWSPIKNWWLRNISNVRTFDE